MSIPEGTTHSISTERYDALDDDAKESLRLFDVIRTACRAEGAAAERARIVALLEALREESAAKPYTVGDRIHRGGIDSALAAVRSASLSPSVGEDAAHE